jgi:cytochrome P450
LFALRGDLLGFLLEMRDYGDVSFAHFGPAPSYMLSDPDMVEELLVGRHRDCVKDSGTRVLMPLIGNGLLTSEGEFWRRQRKLAAPPLQPKHIQAYAETMVDSATRTFASFRDGEVRDLSVELAELTLDIVSKTLLGVDARGDAERIRAALDASMPYFEKQLFTLQALLPAWVPTPGRRRFAAAVREMDVIVYGIIERCRAQGGDADHLLARLLRARDDQGEAMTDAQLRDEAVTMLMAGHETTALALSYAVYLLSEHPAAAARLCDEIDATLEGRAATAADLARMPFLDAVVREVLRIYPPAYAVGREVIREFEIGGYTLPVGSQVTVSPYTLHRDPRFYTEPDRFMPERWVDPGFSPPPRFAYLPFGGGPRVCIGNHFATMELALVLACMMQQVKLTVASDYKLRLSPVVTMRLTDNLRVLVKRRDATSEGRA